MALRKCMLIWFAFVGMATNTYAEGMWLGAIDEHSVIAPIAVFSQGKWKDTWVYPSVFNTDNDAMFSRNHLPMPDLPSFPSDEAIGLKRVGLDHMPAEWMLNGSFPNQWFAVRNKKHYEIDAMQQYEQACVVKWGVHAKQTSGQPNKKTFGFVTSSNHMHVAFFQTVDSNAKEVQDILQKVLVLSKKDEKRDWHKYYQSLEKCQNNYLRLANKAADFQGVNVSYSRKMADLCTRAFSKVKDTRTIDALANIKIERATLQGEMKLYHVRSTLYFPEQNKKDSYTMFSNTLFDGWFIIHNNKSVQYVSRCGDHLKCTCEKSEYYSEYNFVVEVEGRFYMIGGTGCYSGSGVVIDELIGNGVKNVLHHEFGGC